MLCKPVGAVTRFCRAASKRPRPRRPPRLRTRTRRAAGACQGSQGCGPLVAAHLRADGLVQRAQAAARCAAAGRQQRLAVPAVQGGVAEGRQARVRRLQPRPQRACRPGAGAARLVRGPRAGWVRCAALRPRQTRAAHTAGATLLSSTLLAKLQSRSGRSGTERKADQAVCAFRAQCKHTSITDAQLAAQAAGQAPLVADALAASARSSPSPCAAAAAAAAAAGCWATSAACTSSSEPSVAPHASARPANPERSSGVAAAAATCRSACGRRLAAWRAGGSFVVRPRPSPRVYKV